jgi:signal transduction histidine kinase
MTDGREQRYQRIFEHAPVALWENDYTELVVYIAELRAQGVADFEVYLDEHPEALREMARRIQTLDVNFSAIKLMNVPSRETLIGRTLEYILHNAEACRLFKEQMVAFAQGDYHFESESTGWTPDGRPIYALMTVDLLAPTPDGRHRGVASCLDITHRRLAEDALAVANQELGRSNQDLERFAYVVSHDLQEPLRAIAGYSQLMGKHCAGTLDERASHYLGQITAGTERMRVLIDGLLEMSRLSAKAPALRPVDCEEVLAHVLASTEVLRQETGARVTHDPLPRVMGNTVRLAQLFLNLVTNGIKFRGAEPPHVHLSARLEGRTWIISCADNGIGIEAQHLDEIFEMFKRVHAPGMYPGAGIGLAVVKRILEQHQGRIWVESGLGEGSTFYFTLLAADPA